MVESLPPHVQVITGPKSSEDFPMPAETSIPCSKRARNLVREAKGDRSYDEYLTQVFGDVEAV